MRAERCREWRQSLGAYALGQLPEEERVALEAHLEGCPDCRTELASLSSVAELLPLADPARFDTAPALPPALAGRVAAAIGAERRRSSRRRRLRIGLPLSGAVAAAAAMLAIVVLPGGAPSPAQRVAFRSLPPGVRIAATLEPHAFGTEIRMYVGGVPSGTLCRVSLRRADGTAVSAGSFRYRWGNDEEAVLSSALDLSGARALVVHAGRRTFVAPIGART
ncbi:MAG TPA: zf-HC2 domain-containing protein [Solirubrobacterales bacterium]|nr:zf-HC2 domain-containing protein [Solirubrobacterales bacterium]